MPANRMAVLQRFTRLDGVVVIERQYARSPTQLSRISVSISLVEYEGRGQDLARRRKRRAGRILGMGCIFGCRTLHASCEGCGFSSLRSTPRAKFKDRLESAIGKGRIEVWKIRTLENHKGSPPVVPRLLKGSATRPKFKTKARPPAVTKSRKAAHQGIMTGTRNSRAGTCPLRNAGGSGSPCSRQDSTIFRARL